jgi:hypothetical protein
MTRTARVTAGGIGVGALLVVLFAAIRSAPETYPWGDTAATSIYTLRAARHELAVGSYSRFEWNHPGPLLYQLLAPLYVLSGHREISIKWTAWLLNMTSLTALLLIVWRRAPVLAMTIAVALVPLLYREQRLLFWAWNPILPLLPFALAMAVSSAVAAGNLALLPVLAFLVSLLLQSHVAFAPISAVMLLVTVVSLAWRRPLGDSRRTPRHLFVTAIVLAAVWAVPVVNELRHWPGNLSAIGHLFITTPREPRAWSTVLAVVANQLVGPLAPSWELTTAEASSAASWPIVAVAFIQFPLLAVSVARAMKRGARFEASFAMLCFAISLIGVFAVRSIVGPLSDYLITWLAVLGALNLAVVAAAVVPRVGKPWLTFLVLYLVAIGGLGIMRLTSKHASDARSTVVSTLTERLSRYCRDHGIDRPLLRFSTAGWEGASGILLQYYKQDRPIAVPDDQRYLVGDPFGATGRETGEFYLMQETETAIPPGVVRHEWLMTHGSFRLIRLVR